MIIINISIVWVLIYMLNVSHCEKVLGVLINDKLTCIVYIMYVKKASQVCNMILANDIIFKIMS